MLAKVHSVALRGIRAYGVQVELDLANGLPGFTTVGLPSDAVREARSRVGSAVRNSGFKVPPRRITVNLAPAQARKEGTHFDLPIALALLSASGQVAPQPWRLERCCFVGELALDGRVLPVPGVLAMALEAKARGFTAFVAPALNAAEARSGGLPVYAAKTLREAAEFMAGQDEPAPASGWEPDAAEGAAPQEDLADVKGQALAKRALEIAAAGGHNILLVGPPGVGKSMLARRLAGLLPPLCAQESLEVTQIHSAASGAGAAGLIRRRPFRSPHHTATVAALVGGGINPRPGEASLAHGGVLFLDELAEFSRESLEALRQPLEDGRVVVSRAKEAVEFPARFLLAAATNPCPCGYRGHPGRACRCAPGAVKRYLAKLSGPLLDRIDIQVELSPLEFSQWAAPGSGGEGSAAARARVERARRVQAERGAAEGALLNAHLPSRSLRGHCRLGQGALGLLEAAARKMSLSARSLDRALKVARTIADLAGSPEVGPAHAAEAVSLRSLDRLQEAL